MKLKTIKPLMIGLLALGAIFCFMATCHYWGHLSHTPSETDFRNRALCVVWWIGCVLSVLGTALLTKLRT